MVRPTGATGPTLAVVAREAGVSVPTASKVANGRADVAPETRRRVTEVLDRLGYVRRPRFTATAVPALVDLVVHSLDSPWSGAVLHGAEEAAHQVGLELVVSAGLTRTRDSRPEQGWLDRLRSRGSAGVLFNLAELTAGQYAWLERHRISFVMIDPEVEPPAGVPSVGATNEQGGARATRHLIELGHRRIAVIGGRRRTLCSSARIAGYQAAMAAADLRVHPGQVRYGEFTAAGAQAQTAELLAQPAPPTALFACSDDMALGVYRALAERGLRVPQDVSVVGFDDLPQARWATPGLTTVRQPLSEMAATALHRLLRKAQGGVETARVELPTRLVLRSSTAPPPCGPAS